MTIMSMIGDERRKMEFSTDSYYRLTKRELAKKLDCAFCLHYAGATSKGEAVCRERRCPALRSGYDVTGIGIASGKKRSSAGFTEPNAA